MLSTIDALALLLEPGGTQTTDSNGSVTRVATSGVVVDLNAAPPFVYEDEHLYLWATADAHPVAETSTSPGTREDFELTVLYCASSGEEEPKQHRYRAISQAIDTKVHGYVTILAANRSNPGSWQDVRAVIDFDTIRSFDVRGAALRVAGYRWPA